MTEVISVRFRGGCKNYFFDPGDNQIKLGDRVIVETAQGPEFAICTEGNHEVEDSAIVKPLCSVIRMATDADRAAADYNRRRENEAFDICEKKIAEHGLEMKLVSVSVSFDGSKLIFFFTADGRVDFRELVRDLASVFRARIELRQIGVRDEAKMIGGLGICGRPFCCSQFLDSFLPVSIKMAKTQNLSLNPTKISGTCGRLMCCLKYEQNAYEDAARRMPKNESFVMTPDGPGNVKSVDLLREQAKVSLDSAPEPLKCYHQCELCVLRNGKGSREGIDLPAERPARFIPEKPLESEPLMPAIADPFDFEPSFAADVPAEQPAAEPTEDKPHRRRRSRGGRGRGPKPEAARPQGGKPEEGKPEKTQDPRSQSAKPGETRPAPGKSGPTGESPRRRTEPVRSAGEEKPAVRPPEGENADATKRRRPHHRGGRRHRGGGNGAAPAEPKSE